MDVAFEQLRFAVSDRIATITFDRPDRLNAWTATLERELRVAIGLASGDKAVRAIVLTGAGRAFCAGADMERLKTAALNGPPPSPVPDSDDDLNQRYSYLLAVPKPLIAAINGAAAGIGLCIALYCDIRLMARGAKLTTAYAKRGVAAEYGVAWMLPRLIGQMNAADLLLSGRAVDAEEAHAMGLVKMIEAEGFQAAVSAYAARYARDCSPRSIAVIKRQLWLANQQSLAQACRLADEEMAKATQTTDFLEGVAHFVEKRPPQFADY
jgi:enoyl-CoA hydratase/carnithine racemase